MDELTYDDALNIVALEGRKDKRKGIQEGKKEWKEGREDGRKKEKKGRSVCVCMQLCVLL